MDTKKQNLNALIDGELKPHEIDGAVDALLASVEQKHTWQQAFQARALLQNSEHITSSGFADMLAQQLEFQETYSMSNDDIASNVHSFAVARAQQKPSNTSVRAMGIFALAASVLGLAILFGSPRFSAYFDDPATTLISQKGFDSGLQSMIVQHGEFSGTVALNGLIAYAKVVNGVPNER